MMDRICINCQNRIVYKTEAGGALVVTECCKFGVQHLHIVECSHFVPYPRVDTTLKQQSKKALTEGTKQTFDEILKEESEKQNEPKA